MTQPTLFQKERKKIRHSLGATELAVRTVLREYPLLRSVKRRNDLLRKVWAIFGDLPCQSITRTARKLQAQGVFEIEENQKFRANIEQSYREYFA